MIKFKVYYLLEQGCLIERQSVENLVQNWKKAIGQKFGWKLKKAISRNDVRRR